jgi:hypothetical protein
MASNDQMKAIVALRFVPLNFIDIIGFPNVVPTMDIWGDFLPCFKENKEDNPSYHLVKFHEYIDQLDLHHVDVRMKMFMYSLEGNARQWYQSLPSSSISSLTKFHTVFIKHCKRC